LRVIKKRSDGYHEIRGLFQTLDLCDRITLKPSDRDLVTCTNPDVPTDQNNLCFKALKLFREASGIHSRFHIHIEKQIPVGAGLGGGSSNAATLLFMLNRYCGDIFPEKILERIGSQIGADVPFFFSSGCALCEGFGDRVFSRNVEMENEVMIAVPNFGMDTGAVYKECIPRAGDDLPLFQNDLERSAMRINPKLHLLKMQLQGMGFQRVWMTGSGSAFACFGKSNRIETLPVQKFFAKFLYRKNDLWYDSCRWKQKSMMIN